MFRPPPTSTLFPYTTLFRSDVVTLHVPLDASTRGLIAARELSLMKPDALLINTARGAVVDVDAVVDALRSGRIGGDRKSTRLNSSHQIISYAVFCLKKKKQK